jgi:hypothetical protein
MSVFKEDGTFTGRDVYGKIKAAKEANPDSWAVKALSKLWALRYVDYVRFDSEVEAARQEAEEAEKRRAAQKAEEEKRAKEQRENLLQEFKSFLPDALKAVDQESLEKYKTAFNITDADLDITIINQFSKDCIQFMPATSGYVYPINSQKPDKRAELISMLKSELKSGVEKVAADERKKKTKTNTAIDVFKSNQYDNDSVCSAILLGESGTIYYLSANGGYSIEDLSKKIGAEVQNVPYLVDVPEAYKVIYTAVSWSERNYSTYRDTHSYTYYSWDSSEAAKLGSLVPKLGDYTGTWSYGTIVAVESGDGNHYSLMDNIDSWARKNHTSIATD